MVTDPYSNLKVPAHAVVLDVEFTAWEGSMPARWMRPGEFKEIIQLAAVKVDAAFRPIETFDRLVRPKVNPALSAYVEGVTGIGNTDIAARGVDFPAAFSAFSDFAEDLPLVAYGRDDQVLRQNLRLNGMSDRIGPYINIVDWMGAHGFDVRLGHGCDVGPAVGVAFQGRPHNALDDAVSLAAGIAKVMSGGAPSPVSPCIAAAVTQADRIAAALNLAPHPEGGAFVETFRDAPGPDGRARSTEIYFLLRAGEISRKHRVDAAEVWHFYRGAPLALTIEADGRAPRRFVLGPAVENGQRPQVVVPAQAWQSAVSLGDYTLVGCTVAPGFEFSTFEMAD